MEVAFDYCDPGWRLPVLHETHRWDHDNYATFLVGVQRMGWVPRVVEEPEKLFEKDAIVVIDPVREFDAAFRERLDRWLREGGRLLVMDRAENAASTAHQILARYGVAVVPRAGAAGGGRERATVFRAVGPATWFRQISLHRHAAVSGGVPIAAAEGGDAIAAAVEVGRGRVVVCSVSQCFSVDEYGEPGDTPGEARAERYRLEFELLDRLMR